MVNFKPHLKRLFWAFFRPNSRVDKIVRNLYHFPLIIRLKIDLNIFMTNRQSPLTNNFRIKQLLLHSLRDSESETVTFFLQIDEGKEALFRSTLQTIIAQKSSNWEMVIASPKKLFLIETFPFLQDYPSKIKLISSEIDNIQDWIKYSSGQFFVCCHPGDEFSKFFLSIFSIYSDLFPNSQLYYCDCTICAGNKISQYPFIKPESVSIDLQNSIQYLSRSFISCKIGFSYFQSDQFSTNLLCLERMLVRSLIKSGPNFTHIPYMLLHQNDTVAPYQQKHKTMDNQLACHHNQVGTTNSEQSFTRLKWKFDTQLISVVIPTKNNPKYLQRLISSLLIKTSYSDFEIVIIDNQSSSQETLHYYQELSKRKNLRIINFMGEFNYSKAINLGASHASGDLLLFMNDDMEIIQSDWLDELAQWALIPEIGVVGAKLLFPNRRIQHCGVILGMQGIGGHLYHYAPEDYFGLYGSANWYRNVSAVTGACQMVRRSVFEELGGYYEDYRLTFSDIDFCIKAIRKNYRILYNPFSVIIHHQGKSRGYYSPEEDVALARKRMKDFLENGDPYFPKNLTLSPIPRLKQ